MKKLVLTGAAGALGSQLRAPLAAMCDELVSTDIAPLTSDVLGNETYFQADLADYAAIDEALKGADMVVHLGAFVDEGPFEKLLGPNFIGAYNVWEAAFQNGLRRVIYGSSIHAVGMYSKTEAIDSDTPHRPDTFYGLAKCFAEDLGRMYWEKRGLECVHMRILSCSPVANARALGSWLSYGDLIRLVQRCIDTPVTGCTVVYGVSNNDRAPVSNAKAAFLGYRPEDNAEQFAPEILVKTGPMNPQDPFHLCHGGPFAAVKLGEPASSMTKGADHSDE